MKSQYAAVDGIVTCKIIAMFTSENSYMANGNTKIKVWKVCKTSYLGFIIRKGVCFKGLTEFILKAPKKKHDWQGGKLK